MFKFVWLFVIIYFSMFSNVAHGEKQLEIPSEEYRQDGAKVVYINPVYLSNAQSFTARHKRGDPYKSNFTATTLDPWGDNVTFEMSYRQSSMPVPIKFSFTACEISKHAWIYEIIKSHSNIPFQCPVPAGFYYINDIIVPPKNFPLPLLKGKIFVNIKFFLTTTKEDLLINEFAAITA